MEIYNIVELTLEGLKRRLDPQSNLVIQGHQGYCRPVTFTFEPGAVEKDIQAISEELGIVIPWDYEQFLIIHNGGRLFMHPEYGGGMELFGLEQIRQYYINYDYKSMIPDGWYPIGTDNGDMLFIDSNQCQGRFSSYLYWTEMLFVDSALELELNFERWFERLIICNGVHFWEWKRETPDGYYRNVESSIENLKEYEGKNFTLKIPSK